VERSLVDSEILHTMKVGTKSFMLEPRNKYFVFEIAFSLALTLLLLLALVFLLLLHLLFIACIIFIILTCQFHSSQYESN